MDNQEPKRIRRVRYKGTHPKQYNEKYKELQPENYADDVAKVIQQGRTPAGMHRSICVNEIMDFLQIHPGQTGVDATLGYGGHSLEILKQIIPGGKLYGLDVDPFELPRTRDRLKALGFGEDVFIPRIMNFYRIDEIASEAGLLNFVIADLGVSSMQIDNPERGFTFKVDGPLDLRLNPNSGKPASELLKNISREELETILLENSDEPFFREISDAIVSKIENGKFITTTKALRETIVEAISSSISDKEAIKKTNQRCFQALRIAVNNEFSVLEKFLDKLPDCLESGGRVAILTFHSGEDRRVKKAFQYFLREGIYSEVSPTPIRATSEECNANPRARSAKLRLAIKS